MGYPLEVHSWLTPELEERIEQSRRFDQGTLPKTVALEPNYIATSAFSSKKTPPRIGGRIGCGTRCGSTSLTCAGSCSKRLALRPCG
jgi:hypothetical protein